MIARLQDIDQIPAALRPGYIPGNLGTGIVHLGLGAFHKAHLAIMTHQVLEREQGDWRICGVSLRSQTASAALGPQNGLYSVMSQGQRASTMTLVGAIAQALNAVDHMPQIRAAMQDPATRIVSMTVTEKAYGLDRAAGGCDPAHPAIALDLADFENPTGVIGLITHALHHRRAAGIRPFTVLCCDNLPQNGVMIKNAVVDFARRVDAGLGDWIECQVAFPCTMVDRITPAPNAATLTRAQELLGVADLGAVETEDFCQWVIEDHFPTGRPNWDIAGAIFTQDVAKFEEMKLHMLNGAHSMLAYVGFHAGHTFVRDVMQDGQMVRLITRHLHAAAQTLCPIEVIDFETYAQELLERFRNPAIAHETYQIAMDGSEKMPQRVFAPAAKALAQGHDPRPFAFATAAWLRHVCGSTHDCPAYTLRDPMAKRLAALDLGGNAQAIAAQLHHLKIISEEFAQEADFWNVVEEVLHKMRSQSMKQVIAQE